LNSDSGGTVSWAAAWTLGTAQQPAAVLDFVNNQYFDGTSDAAPMNTLVQNATRDASGLICNAGNINVIGNFLTGIKNAGGATVVMEVGGGNNTTFYGLLSMTSGGPDAIIYDSGSGNMIAYNGTVVAGPGGVDFIKTQSFATGYNNAGSIGVSSGGQVTTSAKNFSTITAAQLGSYSGAQFWPGRIRSVAVYTGRLSNTYLKNMSWSANGTCRSTDRRIAISNVTQPL
jgi:hypothetical protein